MPVNLTCSSQAHRPVSSHVVVLCQSGSRAQHAPSKSTLWVPPSMKARLHTPLGASVQYPICMASLDVAPSAMTSILPFTCFPCIRHTCCQTVFYA